MMSTLEKYNGVFPERLRKLLDDRGVTRTELARELNISRQAVSQYADGTGQPNIDKLKTIASFFSVSSDYLIGLSDYERIETKELTAEDMGILDEAAQQLSKDKQDLQGISGAFLSLLAKSPQFGDFASAASDFIQAVNHAKSWSNTVSGVYNERKNVRMKQFLLFEALLDVLAYSVSVPDFVEKEKKAREREASYNAINSEDDE